MATNQTTKNISERVDNVTARSEWIGVSEAMLLFPLGKTKLYELIQANLIKSCCLKKKGQRQGKRLISYSSVNDYFAKLAEEQMSETQIEGGQGV